MRGSWQQRGKGQCKVRVKRQVSKGVKLHAYSITYNRPLEMRRQLGLNLIGRLIVWHTAY